ncbi:MAG: IS110 family transposase [Flavobacterium sp.]|nr:MAG: IS110 family transposase [Flavobacterium sp.]
MTKKEQNQLDKVSWYVGIDVSKATFNYCIRYNGEKVINGKSSNNETAIVELINSMKLLPAFKIPKAVFGLEHTGIYTIKILRQLHKLKANVVLEPATRIKNSLGLLRGKNDKLDAARIAKYLIRNHPFLNLWHPKREIIEHLASLSTLRERVVKMHKAMTTPLKEDFEFFNEKISKKNITLCFRSVSSLEDDLLNIESFMKELINSDDHIKKLMNIMLSVPGIGPVTALQILIHTNEFKTINSARAFAAYCGVAPFEHTSGTSIKKRSKVSPLANKKIKSLLHNGVRTCIANDPELRTYYRRRVDIDMKNKTSMMNAVKFKIICRLFACIKEDRLYQKEYSPKLNKPE